MVCVGYGNISASETLTSEASMANQSIDHEHAGTEQRIKKLEEQVKSLEQQVRELQQAMRTHDHPHKH